MTQATKTHDTQALDALTGGAFTAPTSGERASRVRDWLATEPSHEQMQEVFKELSVKDKGAAKPLREKLDDIKRARGQEALGAEWAAKGHALLATLKLNVADAMAWQRDAAKAGAPLSREPLATLKSQLSDRVRVIEDLQHRVQVQREAAVLLAQRIEILSTKPWRDALAALSFLQADVAHWQDQAQALQADPNWGSVDPKFPPQLEASRAQLLVVWDAFQLAVAQTQAAEKDPQADLPPVPVWADELRVARGVPVQAQAKPAKVKVDPQVRAEAMEKVRDVLSKLEQEIAEGHGKASAGAAAALRQALKEFGKLIDSKMEAQANSALAAAGDLEDWQRWRADQLRQELVGKAEALLKRPEGQAIGGRKMQESLRTLREQWKQTDQGGVPNHALWKRFDAACNEAYKVVEVWLEKIKAESAQNKAQRLALIEELKNWAGENRTALDDDWKGFNRILHQFGDRWREAGHLGEKAFAEMQPLWKAAMTLAAEPLETIQKESLVRRHAMIEEAVALGAAPMLRVDAVKALQQRWQAEAHAIPLERRHEQKLWDAFRQPIDEAFKRKGTERDKAAAELSVRDRVVLDASKALEVANASGDAQKIRSAMAALEDALRGQANAQAAVVVADAAAAEASVQAAATAEQEQEQEGVTAPAAHEVNETGEASATGESSGTSAESADASAAAPEPEPVKVAPPVRKPVVAMRGDDRPGQKKSEPAPQLRGRGGDRKDARGGDRKDSRGAWDGARRGDDFKDRAPAGPRLGDTAFRAQRDALEHAQMALRKLAAQAHGEALTQLLSAWEHRDTAQMPSATDLGGQVNPATRMAWNQALSTAPSGDALKHLLRLEMAAEVPTPASDITARRALQLQLLTRRNDPSPQQTWGQDVAKLLATSFDAGHARRLQAVLKVLMRK